MPVYRYKAISGDGQHLDGELEAGSRTAAVDRLRSVGHFPVSVAEAGGRGGGGWLTRDLFGGRRVSSSEIAMLTRELAVMIQAGVPLDRALEILIDLGKRDGVKRLVGRVLDRVKGGAALADALAAQGGAFSPFYASMVRAGEAGATLDVVLGRLADFMERSEALRQNVRSALVYPTIVLVVAGLSVTFLLTVVLPQFRPLFEDAGAALPLSTQVMLAAGDALKAHWWLMALGLVAGVLLARRLLAHPAARLRWHALLLRLPLVGELVKKVEVARFSRTLAMLLANGLPMLSALSIVTGTVSNRAMARALDGVVGKLKEGRGLHRPLAETGVFPPLCIQLARMGEETGRLEEMLVKVADIFDAEVQRSIDRLLALLVPVVTIFLGIVIAAIITSVLAAIFSVNDLVV